MRRFVVFLVMVLLVGMVVVPAQAKGPARLPAVDDAAARVMELQRTDTDWEGTWFWYVGSTGNATNLTGVTALGLLEAYLDSRDDAYLAAAEQAAAFITDHLGSAANVQPPYWPRATAPDVVFLFRLAEVTGDAGYAAAASDRWDDIVAAYPTAADLDALFHTIHRRSAWDIAFFLEAATLAGDTTWADGAAAIIADTEDAFYYGSDTWWLALNLGGAIRALVESGYGAEYHDSIVVMLERLIGMIGDDGVDGWVQDTAYAVMAFKAVGGAATRYANDLARWLVANQAANGGWLEAGYEFPETNGEALRALAATIGANNTVFGFAPGNIGSSSWQRSDSAAVPFGADS